MKATKFTIDRSKWARGDHPDARLLGRDGTMCCLGFYALACGLTPDDIDEAGDYTVDGPWQNAPGLLPNELLGYSRLHGRLVAANDDVEITDAVREAKLAELFASIGVEVEFVDGDAQ